MRFVFTYLCIYFCKISPEKEWNETPDLPTTAHSDRRLKRLLNREVDDHRLERHRHIHEPEIIGTQEDELTPLESDEVNFSKNAQRWESSEEEDEAEDLDEMTLSAEE